MKLKLTALVLIILTLSVPKISFSQLSFLPLNADYATYQLNDSLAYVEFYVSFFRSNLQYHNIHDTLRASFSTTLKIEFEDSVVYNNSHEFTNSVSDTVEAKTYDQFADIYTMALPFRKFVATITLTDHNANSSGDYLMHLNIPGSTEQFKLSDIQFASNIHKAESKTKFSKNGIEVIPHARRAFDILTPMLYFYVELNNLSYNEAGGTSYSFDYYITNQTGDTVKVNEPKTVKIIGNRQAEVGGFNALSLPTGIYYLNIHAMDNASKITSNCRKRFVVNKPVEKSKNNVADNTGIDPAYATMTMDELKHEIELVKYISTKNEQDIFEQLDSLSAINKFLTNFWKQRDRQSQSTSGTSRRAYLEKVEEANSRFSQGNKEGWETDRGRVLLTYGHPDEIERFQSTEDTKPYSIWKYYQLEGGSEFIFFDRMGFGSYELIHSTYYKELQNPNWQYMIKNTNSGSGFGF